MFLKNKYSHKLLLLKPLRHFQPPPLVKNNYLNINFS